MRTFDRAGDHTFTVPERVSRISVVALGSGGGGGGGGGGGFNDGSLTGGGGGGGGGGGSASCTLAVTTGQTLDLTVGRGGGGGKESRHNNGWKGENGTATVLAVNGMKRVSADFGDYGESGEGSGIVGSGKGDFGGKGGNPKNSLCEGTDPSLLAGQKGEDGHDGSRNSRGIGGNGGRPALYPETCPGAGRGGAGGTGAGVSGARVNDEMQYELATPGRGGRDGCVVLTYTTDAPES